MSYSEIAGLVDLPVGTVKSRIHNGIKKLLTIINALARDEQKD